MTYANYTYAGPAGSGRGGTRNRSGTTKWVVLHTQEGAEGPNSAEGLASFIRSPSTSKDNVASYQLITDTDRVLRIMADELRSHGAAGANDGGLHICFPGRASQTRAQWLDDVSSAYIEQAARATADWCVRWKLPPTRVFAVDMRGDEKGITDHNQVRIAFGQTSHTDVGPNFPWDVFMARVVDLLHPDVPTWPPFDPINTAQFGLWPIATNKPALHIGTRGDAVLYWKGVYHHHVKRFAAWFHATGQGNPDQRNWLNYVATVIQIDGSHDLYDEATFHAAYAMQMAFNYSAYDNQHIGPLDIDGNTRALTWSFIDHCADGTWY